MACVSARPSGFPPPPYPSHRPDPPPPPPPDCPDPPPIQSRSSGSPPVVKYRSGGEGGRGWGHDDPQSGCLDPMDGIRSIWVEIRTLRFVGGVARGRLPHGSFLLLERLFVLSGLVRPHSQQLTLRAEKRRSWADVPANDSQKPTPNPSPGRRGGWGGVWGGFLEVTCPNTAPERLFSAWSVNCATWSIPWKRGTRSARAGYRFVSMAELGFYIGQLPPLCRMSVMMDSTATLRGCGSTGRSQAII